MPEELTDKHTTSANMRAAVEEVTYNLEAAKREGLEPVYCPTCKKKGVETIVALQTKDGNKLQYNRTGSTTGRARLTCKFNHGMTWRPSRGDKNKSKVDRF